MNFQSRVSWPIETLAAVRGVCCELVSHEIPCYTGKIQEIFANQAELGP